MKKIFALVLSIIFVFAIASVSFAAEKKEAAPAAPAAEKKAEKGKSHQITGEVMSIDAKTNTITVKSKKAEVTATTSDKTTVKSGKEKKTLADVKAGDKVEMTFMEADGKNTAKSIDIKAAAKKEDKKEAAPAADKKAPEKKEAAPAAPAPEKKAPAKKAAGGY